MSKPKKNIYNDPFIIICIVPIISFITTIVGSDYDLAYVLSLNFFKIVAFTFVEVLTILGFFRFSLMIIDKRMPLNSTNSKKRFLLILLFTLIGYVIFRFIFTYIEVNVLNWSFTPRIYFNSDLPMEMTILMLINMVYAYWGQVAYNKEINSEKQLVNIVQPSIPKPKFIEIKKNKKTIYLAFNKIAYIYISNTITYLRTVENETHLINDSLNDLHRLLGDENYYRVNRQFLINQLAIHSYKILPNRQIHISLMPPSEIDCKLNKNNSKNFKEWLSTQNRIVKTS